MHNGNIVINFIILSFIFIVIGIIYNIFIIKKRRVSKEDLVLNNDFIKNKRGELEKIIDENNDLRTNYYKKLLHFLIISIIEIIDIVYSFIISSNMNIILGMFILILLGIHVVIY